jgi:hypothetical protein
MHSMKIAVVGCFFTLIFVTYFGSKLNVSLGQSNEIGIQSADGGAPQPAPLPLPHGITAIA